MNMLTIIAFGGFMSPLPPRSTATAVLLVLLMAAYGFLRPRTAGEPEPEPVTVIDLRDGITPTISEAGGPPRPLLDPTPAPEPAEVPADTRSDIG